MTSDEEEAYSRVMDYLRDRYDFERWAVTYKANEDGPDRAAAIQASYEAYQLRHRASTAGPVHGAEYSSPPTTDPTTARLMDVSADGHLAMVRMLEANPDPALSDEVFAYFLKLEDGSWRIHDRVFVDLAGGTSIEGLL